MPIDPKLIELVFRDTSRKLELEPLCRRVIEGSDFPQYSLGAIFDDEERPEFTQYFGESFCGFFTPVRQFGTQCIRWPQDILNHVWVSEGLGCDWKYDAVIYIRCRTCESRIGAVITFAHELQHFKQYGLSYKVWRAEGLCKQVYSGAPLAPWRFPSEFEAQLASQRIAREVLGDEIVMGYAEQKIEEKSDPDKWRFFQGLDPDESFDFLERTKPWVSDYRDALRRRFPARSNKDPDFAKDNWWD
jgi:hypothetical protein